MNITPDSLRNMARQLTAESKKAKEKKNTKSKKDEEVETADVEKSFDSLSKFALGARDKIESSAEDEDDESEDNSGAECEDSSCADEIIDFDTLNAASMDDEDDFEDEVLDLGGDNDDEDEAEDEDDVEDEAEYDIDVIDDFEEEDEYEVDEADDKADNKQKTIRKPGVLKKTGKVVGWLGKNLLSWKGIGAAILGAAFGGMPGLAILAAASVYDKHKEKMNSWLQKHRLAESDDLTAIANSPDAKRVKEYIGSLSKEEQKKLNDTMLNGTDEEKKAAIDKFKEIAGGKAVAENQSEEDCEVEVMEDEEDPSAYAAVILGLNKDAKEQLDKLSDDEQRDVLRRAVNAAEDENGLFEDVSTPQDIARFVQESVYYDKSHALRAADRKYRKLIRENAGKAHVIAHRLDESCKGKPVAERDFCKKFVRIMRVNENRTFYDIRSIFKYSGYKLTSSSHNTREYLYGWIEDPQSGLVISFDLNRQTGWIHYRVVKKDSTLGKEHWSNLQNFREDVRKTFALGD